VAKKTLADRWANRKHRSPDEHLTQRNKVLAKGLAADPWPRIESHQAVGGALITAWKTCALGAGRPGRGRIVS